MEAKISYDLRLKKGVGPIRLGMPRQEIRSILGEPELSRQGSFSLKDLYTSIGLHIDYKPETEICEAIEVLNSVELTYQDGDILSLPWSDMYLWMLENDPELDVRRDTFISHRLGITSGPKFDEYLGHEIQESILIFSEGYWPSEEEIRVTARRENDAMPTGRELTKQLGLEKFFPDEAD
jgi:hypothetical protein